MRCRSKMLRVAAIAEHYFHRLFRRGTLVRLQYPSLWFGEIATASRPPSESGTGHELGILQAAAVTTGRMRANH